MSYAAIGPSSKAIRARLRAGESEGFPNDRKSSQKHSSQHRGCNGWTRFGVRRHENGFAFGHSRNRFLSSSVSWIDPAGARISPSCVGDGSFLRTQDAGDFARTSKDAHHVRPISLLAKSAVSRRKRFYFLRSGVALRVADGSFRNCYSHSLDGSLYPSGRKATGTSFRSSVAGLQKTSAPMALSRSQTAGLQ